MCHHVVDADPNVGGLARRRSRTSAVAIAALTSAVTEFGAPGLVLADNGSAFTGGPTRHRLTRPGRFPTA